MLELGIYKHLVPTGLVQGWRKDDADAGLVSS